MKFSIITVCKNCADIEKTCKSIVAQSFKDFEWIVIDGASDDNTLEILEKYRPYMADFVSEKDSGLYNAMNKGIALAKGQYLIFLNGGDEFYDENVLENVANKIGKSGAKFVFGNAEFHKSEQAPVLKDYSNIRSFKDIENENICHQSIFYHNLLFKKYGKYDEDFSILADYNFNLKVLLNHKVPALFVPYTICKFSQDGTSYSEKNKCKVWEEYQKMIKKRIPKTIKNIVIFENFNILNKDYPRGKIMLIDFTKDGKTYRMKFLNLPVLKIENRINVYKFYFLNIPFFIIRKRFIRFLTKPFFANNYVKTLHSNNPKEFIKIAKDDFIPSEDTTKLIAFYLPQFHTIPLNDEKFGKGFTEWTNVTKALPQFIGHYQPHLPYDVGFYDLSSDKIMYRQIELAKKYGISGFCFHYYWFSGRRLLEKPIFNYLNNKELDLPFCLCWANENWTKVWDGGDKSVICEQKLEQGDYERFFNDILPFMKDERYIKIDNKPVLIVYRPQLFERKVFVEFTNTLRAMAKKAGLNDLYLMCTNFRNFNNNPRLWGLDAMVEFPPHGMRNVQEKVLWDIVNDKFNCWIQDLKEWVENKKYIYEYDFKLFKTVFPMWDNTARKATSGGLVMWGASTETYKKWLKDCIDWTKQNHNKDEQIVFINAWNEWAEGCHLEPCQRHGYAYLNATKEVLEGK